MFDGVNLTHAKRIVSEKVQQSSGLQYLWVILQSSYAVDLMRNSFVYMRIKTAAVDEVMHIVMVMMTRTLRFGGSWKFGMTPGGGVPAGRSRRDCNASGVIAKTSVAILAYLQSSVERR